WFFSLVWVNTRPPATATDEKPPDRSAFQSCLMPPLGHSFKRPVSREMPSRRGPRQQGQSSAFAGRSEDAARTTLTPVRRLSLRQRGKDICGLLSSGREIKGAGIAVPDPRRAGRVVRPP